MSMAAVIPFPRPTEKAVDYPAGPYFIRHEEKTEMNCRDVPGGKIVQIKKTFFDGSDQIEFAIERRVDADTDLDLDGFLAMLDSAIARYFAP